MPKIHLLGIYMFPLSPIRVVCPHCVCFSVRRQRQTHFPFLLREMDSLASITRDLGDQHDHNTNRDWRQRNES